MARADKLTKLIAVFDQFHEALALLDDTRAMELTANWASVRGRYVRPDGIPRSALATGMEQGLREIPMLLESLRPDVRRVVAGALSAAIAAHYPEFLAKDVERLNKILERGFIRGEREYYLLRHHIDISEGEVGKEQELRKYYEMVDRFKGRKR